MDYSAYDHGHDDDDDDDEQEGDEWEDFVSDTEDEASHTPEVHTDDKNYRLSQGRRSSVDIASMSNAHDMELEGDENDEDDRVNNRRASSRASIRSSVSTFEAIAENRVGEDEEDEVDTDDGD